MKKLSSFAPGLALLLLVASFAVVAAHADLVESQPAPGAVLTESPAEIRLTFSEAVGPGSSILLFSEGLQAVEGIVAQNDTAHPEQVFAPLPSLDPSTYTVQWSAVSDDGHEISGTYSFIVSAAATNSTTTDSAADTTSSGGSLNWLIISVIGVGAVLLLYFVTKRRQS